MKNKLIFLKGEKVNLCVPDLEDYEAIELWTEMINNQEINQYISQGYYPQPQSEQIKYIQKSLADRSRILLEIRSEKTHKFLGITSLSNIDHVNKCAQLSVVCPYKCENVKFGGLEARAILTDHAFKKLGLNTINSFPAYPENKRWAQACEVLGYMPTGFLLQSYLSDGKLTNKLIITITAKRYWEISLNRGSIWPGNEKVQEFFLKMKENKSISDNLFEYIDKLVN